MRGEGSRLVKGCESSDCPSPLPRGFVISKETVLITDGFREVFLVVCPRTPSNLSVSKMSLK